MFTYCYFRTMQTTSLSVAAVLLYTAPIMVTIMSVPLFKEKLTASKVAACVLAFTGCIFVTGLLGNAQAVSASGILTGLLSGFGYALYSIFGRFCAESRLSFFYHHRLYLHRCECRSNPLPGFPRLLKRIPKGQLHSPHFDFNGASLPLRSLIPSIRSV